MEHTPQKRTVTDVNDAMEEHVLSYPYVTVNLDQLINACYAPNKKGKSRRLVVTASNIQLAMYTGTRVYNDDSTHNNPLHDIFFPKDIQFLGKDGESVNVDYLKIRGYYAGTTANAFASKAVVHADFFAAPSTLLTTNMHTAIQTINPEYNASIPMTMFDNLDPLIIYNTLSPIEMISENNLEYEVNFGKVVINGSSSKKSDKFSNIFPTEYDYISKMTRTITGLGGYKDYYGRIYFYCDITHGLVRLAVPFQYPDPNNVGKYMTYLSVKEQQVDIHGNVTHLAECHPASEYAFDLTRVHTSTNPTTN